MKKLKCEFEYRTDSHEGVQKYSKEIEFSKEPPSAFHALCQFAYHVFWAEKNVLRDRIIELEAQLAKAKK